MSYSSESSGVRADDTPRPAPQKRFAPELVAAEMSYADQVVGTAGYARLSGTGRGAVEYLVRSLSVSIGRAGFGADCELRSDARTVARHHATIAWDADAESWAIVCHSTTNALMVDGAPVMHDTPPMPLRSRNLIEVGDASFFFLEAVEPSFRTHHIDKLEAEIELLRESRRAGEEREHTRATVSKGRRGRRRDDDVSDDEYGDEEMEEMLQNRREWAKQEEARARSRAREAAAERERAKMYGRDQPGRHSATIPDPGESDDDRALLEPRRDKKRRRSASEFDRDEVSDAEEEHRTLSKRQKKEKKEKKKLKKLKKLKKKKKKRRIEEVAEQRARAGETEDEGDESNDQMDDVDTRNGYEHYDLQPIENEETDTVPLASLRTMKPNGTKRSVRKCRAEWNKKERADFCRAIFAVDVDKVYDGDGNLVCFDWSRFRGIAKLEKKTDEMLAEFHARMMADMEGLLEDEAREKRTKGPRTKHKPGCDCIVCENTRKSRRKKEEENKDDDVEENTQGGYGEEDGGDGVDASIPRPKPERVIGLVTAQKLRVRMSIHEAARQVDSPGGQNVMQKLRSQPNSVAANGDLPSWWRTGVHDHALMIGTARHGVGQWKEIWSDRHNPELARTTCDPEEYPWPTPQAAMKRLREVSSAINAEIRRMAKKKARRQSEDTGSSGVKGKRIQRTAGTPGPKRGRGGSSLRGRKKTGVGKGQLRERDSDSRDDDQDADDASERVQSQDWEGGVVERDDESAEGNGEEEEVEIEIEEEEEGDEEEVEIEIEEEDEEGEEADEIVYNTASDSGQTD